MQKITSASELKDAIHVLEAKQNEDWQILKSSLSDIREGFKPINIIKYTFSEIATAVDLKENLLGAVTGVGVGYITKGIFGNTVSKGIGKLMNTLMQLEVATVISKNSDKVISLGVKALQFLKKKPYRVPESQ